MRSRGPRSNPRNVGRLGRRGTYSVQNQNSLSLKNACNLNSLKLELDVYVLTLSVSRKDDGASAGTVVPADANQGVSPILI